MTAVVLRGDAAHLPLPDESVDLIVCSPPYFGLRAYVDAGEVYDGQIGSEATPREWLDALLTCTRDWVRVLKPSGSIFVNLGDKYAAGHGGSSTEGNGVNLTVRRDRPAAEHWAGADSHPSSSRAVVIPGTRPKSLLGLPWRYALACMDQTLPYVREQFLGGLLSDVLDGIVTHDQARRQLAEFDASPKSKGLGLILRRDIIWSKPNGLPESVTDRCRSSHEYLFHFTVQPRYYAAVDEIREPHLHDGRGMPAELRQLEARIGGRASRGAREADRVAGDNSKAGHPLGKLPGSVWDIPSQPLTVPAGLGVDHFAAFPMELPRRCVLGWSPPGVCTACGEGRRPVTVKGATGRTEDPAAWSETVAYFPAEGRKPITKTPFQRGVTSAITGYACACTPYTDHPGTAGIRPAGHSRSQALGNGVRDNPGGGYGNAERTGPWREYHLEDWAPPPTRPALVVDPFGGTGTTALVASMYGRTGLSFDLSADYCRLARWRTADPAERAKALQVPKPPPVPDGQGSLFDEAS